MQRPIIPLLDLTLPKLSFKNKFREKKQFVVQNLYKGGRRFAISDAYTDNDCREGFAVNSLISLQEKKVCPLE